jgi:hypothetical protein
VLAERYGVHRRTVRQAIDSLPFGECAHAQERIAARIPLG